MLTTYAIGDIHGALAKLGNLVARCEDDAAGREAAFVFIGDYIDRGPDSRGVIDFLIAFAARRERVVFLMGNHEEIALSSADSGTNAANWMANGGDTTLASYGVASAREMPPSHLAWMRALRMRHDDGLRLFVHAGVDPARALDDQADRDLRWIREPFLSSERDHGRLVVHGHTPSMTGKPDVRANRVNIDTAAGYGGPLTAAVFSDETAAPLRFFQVE